MVTRRKKKNGLKKITIIAVSGVACATIFSVAVIANPQLNAQWSMPGAGMSQLANSYFSTQEDNVESDLAAELTASIELETQDIDAVVKEKNADIKKVVAKVVEVNDEALKAKAEEEAAAQEEVVEEVYSEDTYVEEEYSEETYAEEEYTEDTYTEEDYSEEDYSEEDYSEEDYSEEDYSDDDYSYDPYPITGPSAGTEVSDSYALGQEIADYACQFVGWLPYVWAGSSLETGADCSGFTMAVYAQYGYYLCHDSDAQSIQGRSVPLSEAQPGDIVVYSGHVGMYIGNEQVVHCPQPGECVKISSVYMMTVYDVRRIID